MNEDIPKLKSKIKRLERRVEDMMEEFDEIYDRLRTIEAEDNDDFFEITFVDDEE